MIDHKYFEENIPSKHKELLSKLLNKKVTEIIRYSWEPADVAVTEWGIPRSYVFNLTPGPLLITLDSGVAIGFSSQSNLASVTVWAEKTEDGSFSENKITDDDELYPISIIDSNYSPEEFHLTMNQEIVRIKLLLREPINVKYKNLPREAGLVIVLKNNTEIILSHGLHDNSDDFSVLLKSQILPDLLSQLSEVDFLPATD